MSNRPSRLLLPGGITRRGLLTAAGAGGLLWGLGARASGSPRPKKLLFILASGGWDVTYCFDPKLHAPAIEGPEYDDPVNERVETVHGQPLALNDVLRPAVTDFFTEWGHKTAIANGIIVGTLGHHAGRFRMLTGVRGSQPGADLAAIAGKVHGTDLAVGSVALTALGTPGRLVSSTTKVGSRGQLSALLDASTSIPVPPFAPHGDLPLYAADQTARTAVDDWRMKRLDALAARAGSMGRTTQRIDDLRDSIPRAERLRGSASALLTDGPFGAAPDLMSNLAVAVELLHSNACHAVLMDTGHDWDTHTNTVEQHQFFNETFAALSVLAADLDSRGMLDDTLVVITSEMTRTPVHNPSEGKDHWPYTSAVLLGGGTVGGQTLGGTDDALAPIPVDPNTGHPDPAGGAIAFDSFNAGLMERLDIDPKEWLPADVVPWRGGTV